jgi:hypothetical protein
MNTKQRIFSFVIGAFTTLTIGTGLVRSELTNQSKLAINGIDAVRVGMTVKEASKSAKTTLVRGKEDQGNACYYVTPKNGPANLFLMVTSGKIARIDVNKKSLITTLKGAKIGVLQYLLCQTNK